ncbi:RES domain-containing protein [Mycetocola saprophilus]|uniref:RES domain-containing protein n=1 Tax=Mycetocola saprophilus TaxID=76636 RepID=UPI003BF3D91A
MYIDVSESDWSVCLDHIIDDALKAAVENMATDANCTFCGQSGESGQPPHAVNATNLADAFKNGFSFLYTNTDESPHWDRESHMFYGPDMGTAEIVEELSEMAFSDDVRDYIAEKLTAELGPNERWTTWGASADPEDLEFVWSRFEEYVKHQGRFFFPGGSTAESHPTGITAFLKMLDHYSSGSSGLIQMVNPGDNFYRGRLCENPKDFEHILDELGMAPAKLATANRMSPAGISLFYAAQNPKTAIAEIAAHGTAPLAVVGVFTNLRELRILDFTIKPKTPSPFDTSRREEYRHLRFLDSFVEEITKPVISDGRQHIDYVPTQVLTEYIRNWAREKIDGIALPSAQTTDKTYVFFSSSTEFSANGVEERLSHLVRSAGMHFEKPTFDFESDKTRTYEVTRVVRAEELKS